MNSVPLISILFRIIFTFIRELSPAVINLSIVLLLKDGFAVLLTINS